MDEVSFVASGPIILVRDIEASADYWEQKIGFEVRRYGLPVHTCVATRGGARLLLQKVPLGAQLLPNYHILDKCSDAYIWVKGIHQLYEDLKARGAKIDFSLFKTPWNMWEFGIQDLDDHDITFGEPASTDSNS